MARISTRNESPDWACSAPWRARTRAWPARTVLAALAAACIASALVIGGLALLEAALPAPGARAPAPPIGWRAYNGRPSQISLACAQREPALCALD
jgi:hypothetical protein